MKRRTPKQEKTEIIGMEAGEYEARLVYVADLGMQEQWDKEKPPVQQGSLGLELIGHTVEIDGEVKPRLMWSRPFNMFQTLTEKGKEIEFYRIFSPAAQPGEVADWETVLGEPCMVTVGKKRKEDKEYDEIVAINPIPAKYKKDVGDATINPGTGDCDDPDNPVNTALYGLTRYKFDNRIREPLPF